MVRFINFEFKQKYFLDFFDKHQIGNDKDDWLQPINPTGNFGSTRGSQEIQGAKTWAFI